MSQKTAYEAAAYETDKDTLLKLLEVLKNCGIPDSYTKYDDISEAHVIYVNTKDFTRAKTIITEFYEDISDNISDEAPEGETSICQSDPAPIYADSEDRYKDNLSSAYTFLVFGIVGIIVIALYDFGFIPIFSMALPSKILFNVVMGIVFIGFIAAGAFSFKYSKRLKLQIDVSSAKSDDIIEYLKANLTKDDIEGSCSHDALPDEMRYYKRIDAIKKCITDKFGEQTEEFMNDVCDLYYDSLYDE